MAGATLKRRSAAGEVCGCVDSGAALRLPLRANVKNSGIRGEMGQAMGRAVGPCNRVCSRTVGPPEGQRVSSVQRYKRQRRDSIPAQAPGLGKFGISFFPGLKVRNICSRHVRKYRTVVSSEIGNRGAAPVDFRISTLENVLYIVFLLSLTAGSAPVRSHHPQALRQGRPA